MGFFNDLVNDFCPLEIVDTSLDFTWSNSLSKIDSFLVSSQRAVEFCALEVFIYQG